MKSLRFRSYTRYGVKWTVLRIIKEIQVGYWDKIYNPKPKGVVYR